MLSPPPPLPPIPRMRALRKWLNDLRDYAASLNPMPSRNIQVLHSAIGTSWVGSAPTSTPNAVSQYRLKDFDADDYFVCRLLTPDPVGPGRFTEGAKDVHIAKPYLLRVTEFDAAEFSIIVESLSGGVSSGTTKRLSYQYYSATFRTESDITVPASPVDENQTIIPRYVVDEDIIYAIEQPDLAMTDAAGDPITLLALADGRAWAKSQ